MHQIRSLFSGAAAKTALVSGAVSVRCLFWQVLINAGQRWADPRALQPPGDAQEHAPGEKKNYCVTPVLDCSPLQIAPTRPFHYCFVDRSQLNIPIRVWPDP